MDPIQDSIRFPLDDVTNKAYRYAREAHELVKQKRKYTKEPYITHPIAVTNSMWDFCQQYPDIGFTSVHYASALLHDVLEDTCTTENSKESRQSDILQLCGVEVLTLVIGLTNPFTPPEHGNRHKRVQLELARIEQESADVHTIKCFDLIHNTESIVQHDHSFARVYLPEKRDTLEVLTKADKRVIDLAMQSLIQAEKHIMQESLRW